MNFYVLIIYNKHKEENIKHIFTYIYMSRARTGTQYTYLLHCTKGKTMLLFPLRNVILVLFSCRRTTFNKAGKNTRHVVK